VLLILIFVCSVHTSAVVLDAADFVCNAEKGMLSMEIPERAHFKATLTEFELPAPFNFPALDTLRADDSVKDPLPGSAVFKYRTGRDIYATNLPGAGEAGPDTGQSRLQMSDEPVPTIAILVLVGLVAFIALNRRRK
jgi:hypothetical protein